MSKKKFVKKEAQKESSEPPKKKFHLAFPHMKFTKILIPELLIIPFLIINTLILAGCISLSKKISNIHFVDDNFTKMQNLVIPDVTTDVTLPITARSYIVYDPQSRMVIKGKNEYLQFAPASATKLMTALVALDQYKEEDVLIARGVSKVKGSKMDLIEGEAMTVKNLLYGLLLPSGNDAAFVLASNYPGGQEAFVQAMNKKAQELSLDNTTFVDPAGLKDENFTTAYDLARLAAVAVSNPTISEIVKTQYATVYNTAFTSAYPLTNLNELLYDTNVFGIKTGFTDEAGGVLVTGYNYEGRKYIVAVLKTPDRFYDTQQILYGIIPQISLSTYSTR